MSSVLYGSPTDFSKDEESLSLSHAESTVEENVIPGSETAEEAISSRFDTMNLSVSEDDYESEDEEQTSVYAQEVASAVEEQENGVIEANNTGDDDEAGWITPSNIAKVYQKMGIRSNRSAMVSHKVACLTTDFSVQVSKFNRQIQTVTKDRTVPMCPYPWSDGFSRKSDRYWEVQHFLTSRDLSATQKSSIKKCSSPKVVPG